MTTCSNRPYGGHDELTRSDTPAEPLISAVRGGASLVRQPHSLNQALFRFRRLHAAALQFSLSLSRDFSGLPCLARPAFVVGVYRLEPGLLGAELPGERFRAGGLGLVVPDFRVRGLLPGVGLGLGRQSQLSGYVRRSERLGAAAFGDCSPRAARGSLPGRGLR